MNILAEAATTHAGFTAEHGIVLTNILLILVTLALVVTTTMDNHNMAKIAMILARKVVRRDRNNGEYKPRHSR